MLYVFLLYALFASVFTIGKTALQFTEPLFLIGTRMMVAGALLIAYQVIRNKASFKFNASIWRQIIFLSACNIYLTNAFEFWGLKYLTSFKTCFIYSLSPFVSALFCYLIFSEKMTKAKWTGLLIGFLGFIPILLSQTSSEEQAGQLFIFSWAELSVVMAVITSVYGWILLKQLVKDNGVSPLSANGLSMLIGGGMALIHSLAVEDWNPIPVTEFMPFLECSLLLIIISNLICYNMYGWLLKRYSPTFMSFAGFTTPVFTALFGWFFLGEVVTWPFYISFVVVIAGLAIFDQDELKKSLPAVDKDYDPSTT